MAKKPIGNPLGRGFGVPPEVLPRISPTVEARLLLATLGMGRESLLCAFER